MKINNIFINFILFFLIISSRGHTIDLEGNFIQGGLVFGKLEQNAKVFLDNKEIPVDKNGNFLFGL